MNTEDITLANKYQQKTDIDLPRQIVYANRVLR